MKYEKCEIYIDICAKQKNCVAYTTYNNTAMYNEQAVCFVEQFCETRKLWDLYKADTMYPANLKIYSKHSSV